MSAYRKFTALCDDLLDRRPLTVRQMDKLHASWKAWEREHAADLRHGLDFGGTFSLPPPLEPWESVEDRFAPEGWEPPHEREARARRERGAEAGKRGPGRPKRGDADVDVYVAEYVDGPRDSRRTQADIAKKTGVSESTVSNRIAAYRKAKAAKNSANNSR